MHRDEKDGAVKGRLGWVVTMPAGKPSQFPAPTQPAPTATQPPAHPQLGRRGCEPVSWLRQVLACSA